ncbi:hypothetical protein QQ054_27585 [Oscillatoria amoena NRMC-F 0135]|nr:hypothetical protein [Oscillatoria amoena NRMC-F 0135]
MALLAVTVLSMALLAADPFWLPKPIQQWDEEELEQFFTDSPWARPAEAVAMRGNTRVSTRTFLASAAPMRLAEEEWRRRRLPKEQRESDDAWQEWREFIEKDSARYIVLAVAIPLSHASDAREMAEMENQSVMRFGRKKVKMSGYFPATERDPYTRLLFPREGTESAKDIVFELYIPGEGGNFREAIYLAKELTWKGRKEI